MTRPLTLLQLLIVPLIKQLLLKLREPCPAKKTLIRQPARPRDIATKLQDQEQDSWPQSVSLLQTNDAPAPLRGRDYVS